MNPEAAATPESGHGLLAACQCAMPRLAALLDGAGLRIGPDRWQNVYDLLIALAAQGRLPVDLAGLRPLLAPLFCSSAPEQTQFGALFEEWLRDEALRPWRTGTESAAIPSVAPLAPVPQLPRTGRWLAALLLGWCGLVAGWYGYDVMHLPQPEPVPVVPQISPAPVADGLPPAADLAPEPILPRRPPERVALDDEHGTWLPVLDRAVIVLPGALALGWFLLRWRSWRTVLRRRRGNPDDPLRPIQLDATLDRLADAPELRTALKRLHTPVDVPTRRLNAALTVERTARSAGLFRPVCRRRRRVPDLVVAVEYQHARDQMAGLAAQVVERLKNAGLEVHRYSYLDTPLRLLGPDGRWHRLADLADRHAGARLLLIGEPGALIDPFGDEPLPWTRSLSVWPRRSLLATRRAPERWVRALARYGLVVADLDSAGLQAAVLHLCGEPAADIGWLARTTELLPRLLQDGSRWLQPVAPPAADRTEMLATLEKFLGPDGLLLFTAMAAYPQLDWMLTRGLDLNLFPDSPDAWRERRLLKIARLPWNRQGWMPDWLRRSLLAQLDTSNWKRLRALYRTLFAGATTTGDGDIRLPVAVPSGKDAALGWHSHARRLRSWLHRLRELSPEGGVLRDAILADVLLGWRLRLLDFVLPQSVLQGFLRGALGRALGRAALLALLAGVLGAWGMEWLWLAAGRTSVETLLLGQQKATNAGYDIDIRYRPGTEALATSVHAALLAEGYRASTPVSVKPVEPPAEAVNRAQWGEDADTAIAERVAARVRYLAWGQAAEVTNSPGDFASDPDLQKALQPKHLRVLLASPGATGSMFRDLLVHTLSADERVRLQRGEITDRDPLKIGGFGPEMIPLPAGTFTMGSPDQEKDRYNDEGPQHTVTVSAFALSRTEVSFADYDRFAEATGRAKPEDYWGRGNQPVINVSWNDAQAYADWLSAQTGKQYRLPSEAEWEYAARAGTTTPFWTGDCIKTDQANYSGIIDYYNCGAKTRVSRQKTVEVGSLPANAWGLHETAGNVWEWTADCWHDNYAGAPTDGSAWREGSGDDCALRVLRGGSWFDEQPFLRSATRLRNSVDVAVIPVGIRLAKTP